jgi:hypothetical protein
MDDDDIKVEHIHEWVEWDEDNEGVVYWCNCGATRK